MQTFLPYSNFHATAVCLDYRRLGCQRKETLQILNTLKNPTSKGWKNHPAVKMWAGYENALVQYGQTICLHWIDRGYKDTCLKKIIDHYDKSKDIVYPPWLGDETFHASHRAALLCKNPEFYGQYNWDESPKIEYVWPI